jgi:hypothetical protein
MYKLSFKACVVCNNRAAAQYICRLKPATARIERGNHVNVSTVQSFGKAGTAILDCRITSGW